MSHELKRAIMAKKASVQAIIKNALLLAAMIAVCIMTESMALLTDIIFTTANILASFVLISGFNFSLKPPDPKYHYGYAKAEATTAAFLAVALFPLSFYLGYKAISALYLNEIHVHDNIYAILVLVTALVLKEYSYLHTKKLAKEIKSTALMAKAWYHRNAALSSLAALLGVLGSTVGLPQLDPIAAVIVSLLIFAMAIFLSRDALTELLDSAPEMETMEAIDKAAAACPGVKGVHRIRARKHGASVLVDINIFVGEDISIKEGVSIIQELKERIRKDVEEVKEVTVELSLARADDAVGSPE